MSKTINTRISQKHDFEVNWNKASGFIPNAGEIIIYDAEVDANGNELTGVRDSSGNLPGSRTEPITTARIKVGDGRRNVIALEFASSSNNAEIVPVTQGGTGATTAAQARTNLGVTPANIGAVPTSRTVIGRDNSVHRSESLVCNSKSTQDQNICFIMYTSVMIQTTYILEV